MFPEYISTAETLTVTTTQIPYGFSECCHALHDISHLCLDVLSGDAASFFLHLHPPSTLGIQYIFFCTAANIYGGRKLTESCAFLRNCSFKLE